MSIQSEVQRITTNVQTSLSLIANEGVYIAEGANSDDLPDAISELIDGMPTASILVTGPSNTDTVIATKDGKTITGVWTQKPNPALVVPDGYTQLEYIESTGTQYIDTGWKPAKGDTLTIESSLSSNANESGFAGYTSQWELYYDVNKNVLAWSSGTTITALQIANSPVALNQKNTVQVRFDSAQSKGTGYLFTYRPGDYPFNGRIYSAAVKNSAGTILRNFIPAKRNSDNVIGLYDLANDVFYTNAGSGTFVAGAEIPSTIGCFSIEQIRSYGMWAVTATNGEKTATRNVLVDAAVEYGIELYYRTYLYYQGDNIAGFSKTYHNGSGGASVTFNDDHVQLYASYNYEGTQCILSMRTAEKIDVSNFSKVGFLIDSITGNPWYVEFGLTNASPMRTDGNHVTNGYVEHAGDDPGEVIVDISTITGSYYVEVCINTGQLCTCYLNLSEIWLE